MTSDHPDSLLEGPALADALQEIAEEAGRAVARADAAGAVVQRGPDLLRASSAPLAARVDAAQYRIEQGPCLHAFHTGRAVLLDVDHQDGRWPDFRAAATAAGARTVLSLPLQLEDRSIGSLNLYSRAAGAFDAQAVHEAELFARPSALRLVRVGAAVHAVEAVEVVGLELQDRATIDLALGVLMGVHGDASVGAARLRLERAAADLGLGVAATAARIVASPPAAGKGDRRL